MNFSHLYFIGGRQASDDFKKLVKIIKEGAFLENTVAWTIVGSNTTDGNSLEVQTVEIDQSTTKVKDNFFVKLDRLKTTVHS